MIRWYNGDNLFGTSKGTSITMFSNFIFYPIIVQFIISILKGFKVICLKLENFDVLTVDLNHHSAKGLAEEDLETSEDGQVVRGKYETSLYDLDLDGSSVCRPGWTLLKQDCLNLGLDESVAQDPLALLEINLRTWISMRDLLKRECMAQAPMIESTLVLTILIPVFFLVCIAHEVYIRDDAWFTTFNTIACLHCVLFLAFASEALLLCVDANASFDSHNDKVAKNKESFLRRRKQAGEGARALGKSQAEQDHDSVRLYAMDVQMDRVEAYVKYLHISNVMDTMIQKIETKDVPITLLSVKVNKRLQQRAMAVAASYLFTLACFVAQRYDVVSNFEKTIGV